MLSLFHYFTTFVVSKRIYCYSIASVNTSFYCVTVLLSSGRWNVRRADSMEVCAVFSVAGRHQFFSAGLWLERLQSAPATPKFKEDRTVRSFGHRCSLEAAKTCTRIFFGRN